MKTPKQRALEYTAEQQAEARKNLRRIACAGKVGFESRAVASAVARRRRDKGKGGSAAYKCRGCGKYHIGDPVWVEQKKHKPR